VFSSNPTDLHTFHRHKPVYFEEDISTGKPVLSEEGRKAVKAELERAKEQ
jgi:hypothetical protein